MAAFKIKLKITCLSPTCCSMRTCGLVRIKPAIVCSDVYDKHPDGFTIPTGVQERESPGYL